MTGGVVDNDSVQLSACQATFDLVCQGYYTGYQGYHTGYQGYYIGYQGYHTGYYTGYPDSSSARALHAMHHTMLCHAMSCHAV